MTRILAVTLGIAVSLATLAASPASGQSRFGQSFTAPLTDAFLRRVDTGGLLGPDPGRVYTYLLFQLSGTELTGPALFQRSVVGPTGPDRAVKVKLPLTPGEMYAFLIANTGGGSMGAFSGPDVIPEGQQISCPVGSPCEAPFGGGDVRGFSLRFGTTPEPLSLALVGTGLVGVGVVRRRRGKPRLR